jgi:hypothetical protein
MKKDIASSIRQRLVNYSKENNDEFQLTLTRYGLQRLVFRITSSPYSHSFVLKGAMLFTLWTDEKYRSTRDLDLLGFGGAGIPEMEQIFKEICDISDPEDGLIFLKESVKGEAIRKEEEYQGVRITFQARLGNAKIPIQVDIGFGDAITPAATEIDFPNILGLSTARIRSYPKETVVAEKFQAMTNLGMANSRLKDFYDIWFLAKSFPFAGTDLSKAIENTFRHRQTKLPTSVPVALTKDFFADQQKKAQWVAFLGKTKASARPDSLADVATLLTTFLMPPTVAIAKNQVFDSTWSDGGPWK